MLISRRIAGRAGSFLFPQTSLELGLARGDSTTSKSPRWRLPGRVAELGTAEDRAKYGPLLKEMADRERNSWIYVELDPNS
jgi:hypothetical protein